MIYDLIYDGAQYKKELEKLFPNAKIEDASDEIHRGRVSINVKMKVDEYQRIIMLNGFYRMSLSLLLYNTKELLEKLKIWQVEYPEYFKQEDKG